MVYRKTSGHTTRRCLMSLCEMRKKFFLWGFESYLETVRVSGVDLNCSVRIAMTEDSQGIRIKRRQRLDEKAVHRTVKNECKDVHRVQKVLVLRPVVELK